jgi:hypothetical protein
VLHAGQTAVIVPVPAAEPMVSRWRARLDSSGAPGMPAHITALYPFVPEKRLTGGLLEDLRRLCRARPALDVASIARAVSRRCSISIQSPLTSSDS